MVGAGRSLGTNFILFLVLSSVGCPITRFPSTLGTLGTLGGYRGGGRACQEGFSFFVFLNFLIFFPPKVSHGVLRPKLCLCIHSPKALAILRGGGAERMTQGVARCVTSGQRGVATVLRLTADEHMSTRSGKTESMHVSS